MRPLDLILGFWSRMGPYQEPPVDWYPSTAACMRAIHPRAHLVASALSPGTSWDNVMDYLPAAVAACEGGNVPLGPFYGSNRAKALLAFQRGLDAFDPRSAPKTRAFAANLEGDLEPVTVDRWAGRIAGIEPSSLGRYREAEAAYRQAAGIVGLAPATLQARTWVAAREGLL